MRKLILAAALFLLLGARTAWANRIVQGWCEAGNQPVVTLSLTSTTVVQQSYPGCTVSVFVHGGGLASISSDNSGTALANPFVASSNGRWIFAVANGRYDVQLTNILPALNVTYSDIVADIVAFDPTGINRILYGASGGMKCDGVTDDTAALNAILVTAASSPTQVILPPGTCIINTRGTDVHIPDNIWLQGAGTFTTILKRANNANSRNAMMDFIGTSATAILSDFTLDGNKANQTTQANTLLGPNGQTRNIVKTVVQRVRFINAANTALALFVNPGFYVQDALVEDNQFENNGTSSTTCFSSMDIFIREPIRLRLLHNRSDGALGDFACVVGGSDPNTGYNIIQQNSVNNAAGFAVALGSTTTGDNVSNNTFNMPNRAGNVIDLGLATNTVVSGNYITLGATSSVGIADGPPTSGLTLTRNVIINSNAAANTAGISISCIDTVIAANVIIGMGGAGIITSVGAGQTTKDCIIDHNVVKNSGRSVASAAIETNLNTGATARGITIKNNILYDDQGTPTQTYGIILASCCGQRAGYSNITVEGNDIRGNKLGGIQNNMSGATGVLISTTPEARRRRPEP